MKTSFVLRKFTVLLALSSLSLAVMNCSKGDSDTPSAQIVGSWKITNIFVKEGTAAEADQFPLLITFLPCFKDIVFTFKSNGELAGSVPKECQSTTDDFIGTSGIAKYEIVAGKLTITDTDGTKSTEDVTFSGKTMTWSSSEKSGNITTTTRVVFAKQ